MIGLVPFLSNETNVTPALDVAGVVTGTAPKGTEAAGICVHVHVEPDFTPFCRPSWVEPYQRMLELLGSTWRRSPKALGTSLPATMIVLLIAVHVAPLSVEA